MKVESESEIAQSCPTLSDPTDCSPPGSSIHGIFQARVLEWVAVVFSKDRYRYIDINMMYIIIHIWKVTQTINNATTQGAGRKNGALILNSVCPER